MTNKIICKSIHFKCNDTADAAETKRPIYLNRICNALTSMCTPTLTVSPLTHVIVSRAALTTAALNFGTRSSLDHRRAVDPIIL